MRNSDDPQNIYDDAAFFAGYTSLDRFQTAWGSAFEHRAFTELIGDCDGLRVLDLGCGGGHLAFHLVQAGAAEVIAIDASANMLEIARAKRRHPRIDYRRTTMEAADFPANRFDLIVSSLAIHYIGDYYGLLSRIADWLVPGGRLVFSTEHPIFTARHTDDGWLRDADGSRAAWAIHDYFHEGQREHTWFVPGVRRYHRSISTLLNGIVDAGLTIERIVEPAVDDAWLRAHPSDEDDRHRPIFLLIRAAKP